MSMNIKVGATYRHVKRGSTYTVLGRAKMQIGYHQLLGRCPLNDVDKVCAHLERISMVTYRAHEDDTLWVRPEEEFCDGRFELCTRMDALVSSVSAKLAELGIDGDGVLDLAEWIEAKIIEGETR